MKTNEPIDVQAEPTQAVAIRDQSPQGILRPADSLDRIAEAFKEYQRVCETILDASDYQDYEGKPRKKKSAWRKLGTAFNVSTAVIKEEIERTQERHVLSASYTVCAYTGPKSAPFRQFEAVGYCDINEKCCPTSRGEKCHKAAWKGHYCCVNGCNGRKHWNHPDHDVKSTAQTRATNRAIADLIGCGEVSAEELVDEGPKQTPAKPVAKPKPENKPAPEPLKPKFATNATRAWMIEKIQGREGEQNRAIATEYFQKCSQLLPTEQLEDLPLRFVPTNWTQLRALTSCIANFEAGGDAVRAFDANSEPNSLETPNLTREQHEPKQASDDEWWREIIVPIPHKGERKADYDKHPETIGQLYELRHGNDEESESARRRLWGLVNNFDPKPRDFRGKTYQPSAADLKCREALDAFSAWFEKNHPDEKL